MTIMLNCDKHLYIDREESYIMITTMPYKVGILGSGMVGQTLADGFLKAGYEVKIGTRDKSKLATWASKAGKNASVGKFSEAAAFGELIALCCKGEAVEDVITLAEKKNLEKKLIIDVTNPLVFEEGKMPKMFIGYPDSLGAMIQELVPEAKVVKAFNTVPATYMCNAKLTEGVPDLFIAGNDAGAKKTVSDLAKTWGWGVIDMGGIEEASLLEALALTFIHYGILNNQWTHAFKLLKK